MGRFSRVRRIALIITIGLVACVPAAPTVTLTPTPLPSATPTHTTTPVWFPPTETPTPAPSLTPRPTEPTRPDVGEVLVEDLFVDGAWPISATGVGRISLRNGQLTLAVQQAKGTLNSLREGTLPADGYLEVTASAALCQGDDVYGLLLRAASSFNAYRLLVSCRGELRMERLYNGEVALMQAWTPSGEIPGGGLLPVRFGIWSLGGELRIFVNDVHQFTVRDPVFPEGQLGVYARSAGNTPLTVTFNKGKVYALASTNLAETPAVESTPTP